MAPESRNAEIERVLKAVTVAWSNREEVVVHTTRVVAALRNLQAGNTVAAGRVSGAHGPPAARAAWWPMGETTLSVVAVEALGMRTDRGLGPILPGVPVWRLGDEMHWPGLPLIVSPGNVGAPDSLAQLIQALRG